MIQEKISISKYFKDNQPVITGIALFIALAQLSKSYIQDGQTASIIIGLFLGLVFLMCIELIRNFPKNASEFLIFYRIFFYLAIGAFAYYWITVNLGFIVLMFLGMISGFVIGGIYFGYKFLRYRKNWREHI